MAKLRMLGADVEDALERVNVPSYVIDEGGVIRWLNEAASRVVGDMRGRQFTSVVAPEDTRRARELFARKLAGTAEVTDAEIVVLDRRGERIKIDLSSVPLVRRHRVIGVFGQVRRIEVDPQPRPHRRLTPRQTEVLSLLEHGLSTEQIAERLHLSRETVRNHIRGILRRLGVHSRLEAVAIARREGLEPN
jgi:PAS domain S-box-containing protein